MLRGAGLEVCVTFNSSSKSKITMVDKAVCNANWWFTFHFLFYLFLFVIYFMIKQKIKLIRDVN